jgi:hypothetical protein
VRFKQRAVIEFLVVKKESVTNIPNRIKCAYTLSLLLMKVILAVGLHELQIFHPPDLTNWNVTSFIYSARHLPAYGKRVSPTSW